LFCWLRASVAISYTGNINDFRFTVVMSELLTIITNVDKLRIKPMKIIIDRAYYKDFTIGMCSLNDFNFVSLELPDLDNQKNISCIPEGTYWAKKRISPGKGYEVIELLNVPNRTYIQAHYGNYTRQLLGCQLYGDGLKFLDNDDIIDITNSEKTIKKVLSMLPQRFQIEIRGNKL
jgi:hypothetical protein